MGANPLLNFKIKLVEKNIHDIRQIMFTVPFISQYA